MRLPRTATNVNRLLRALELLGFGSMGLTEADFMQPEAVVQLGFPPAPHDHACERRPLVHHQLERFSHQRAGLRKVERPGRPGEPGRARGASRRLLTQGLREVSAALPVDDHRCMRLMIHFAMNLTRTETYLAAFHDANPGTTSRAFKALPVSRGGLAFASTYASLISMLPEGGSQPLTVLDLACGDDHLLSLLSRLMSCSATSR